MPVLTNQLMRCTWCETRKVLRYGVCAECFARYRDKQPPAIVAFVEAHPFPQEALAVVMARVEARGREIHERDMALRRAEEERAARKPAPVPSEAEESGNDVPAEPSYSSASVSSLAPAPPASEHTGFRSDTSSYRTTMGGEG